MRIKEKKNFNLAMERMIKQQIFALEMDVLTSRLQRLQLDDKIVTLLHELWDKMKIGGRRKVEITNDDGMKVTIGELIVRTFYFTNDKKFRRQIRWNIKSSLQNEQWLHSSVGWSVAPVSRGHGFQPGWSPDSFRLLYTQLFKLSS